MIRMPGRSRRAAFPGAPAPSVTLFAAPLATPFVARFVALFAAACLGAIGPAPGLAAPAARDPVDGLVRRLDRYLQHNEVDGVTMDWRYTVSPSEEIRQTVVCQVLAYAELHRMRPNHHLRREIVEHADFLLGRLEEIRSHSPFDGMLALALLSAWERTGEPRFLDAGRAVTDDLLAIPTSQCVLNGGLMVAMATALDAQLTGNEVSRQKTHDILAGLPPYQNEDGSFPHWCRDSRDIHYTGWMSMELIHIARLIDDPVIAPTLERMTAYLEQRIGPDGRAVYEEPCPGIPDCTIFHYSRATGCMQDHDTRGWTVEPAYCTFLFDHQGSAKFGPVAGFLDALEDGGTFADLYGYWPPPDDPEYVWTIADTSAANMSIIFWALASTLNDRVRRGETPSVALWMGEQDATLEDPPGAAGAGTGPGSEAGGGSRPALTAAPNPFRGSTSLHFALEHPARVALTVVDLRGATVRTIDGGTSGAGEQSLAWDGRDDAGRATPAGVYFIRLHDDGQVLGSARLIRVP